MIQDYLSKSKSLFYSLLITFPLFLVYEIGIFFLISNQFSARFLVPRIGTKIVMSSAMILISFGTVLLVIVPNYSLFLLCSISSTIEKIKILANDKFNRA